MTRKHFQALARELHRCKPPDTHLTRYRQWNQCISAVAHVCKDYNDRFDHDRFYKACEVGVR